MAVGQRAPRARVQVLNTALPAPRLFRSAPEVRDAHLDAKGMLLPWMLTPLAPLVALFFLSRATNFFSSETL
eukprot:9776395-Lingulodinium_polyedra.AAC.1